MNRKLEKSLDRKVCDISGLLLVSLHVLSCVLEYVQNQYRSSRPEVFCKKVGLRNFAKFTGKQLCQSFFLNKVAGLKKETLAQVFSWEFCEISKNTFFHRTPLVAEHLCSSYCTSNFQVWWHSCTFALFSDSLNESTSPAPYATTPSPNHQASKIYSNLIKVNVRCSKVQAACSYSWCNDVWCGPCQKPFFKQDISSTKQLSFNAYLFVETKSTYVETNLCCFKRPSFILLQRRWKRSFWWWNHPTHSCS